MPHVDDLLLRETIHRCNNDLQLVIGLLGLQSRQAVNPEVRRALADVMERVSIIARARNAMHRELQPSLEVALQQVCDALGAYAEPRSIAISLRTDGEAHAIAEGRITTLALVVNELVTNAIKHAFEDGRAGEVQVSIDYDANDVVITVRDDGLPFTNATRDGGLGLGLAKRLMASVGGHLVMPPPGFKAFELRVPLNACTA